MAKKEVQVEETKSKIQQRREELQAQLDVLEVLQDVEDELNRLIKSYEDSAESALEDAVYKGKEKTQATDRDGNLLYAVDGEWHKYTQAELDKEGIKEGFEPYYKDIYETVKRKPEELDSWSKGRYLKYIKLVELLKKVEVL